MLGIRLYLAQRISAMIIAPLVLLHLVVMIYAIQGGLSAEEILGRTQGSVLWGVNYAVFVIAVAVHGAIGLRVVIYETFGLSKTALDFITLIIATSLLALGGRAVYAVIWP